MNIRLDVSRQAVVDAVRELSLAERIDTARAIACDLPDLELRVLVQRLADDAGLELVT